MFRTLPSVALALGLSASPLFAQQVRPAVDVGTSPVGSASGPQVASFDDRTVAVYVDEGTGNVLACASDAAGTDWSAPVQVDRDLTGAPKTTGFQEGNETLLVSGERVLVTWRDARNGRDDLYVSRSTDGAATFEPLDRRVDDGAAPGAAAVRDWSVALARDPGGDPDSDLVAILLSVEDEGGSGPEPESLWLVVSSDGGATFGPAQPVSTANGTGADVDDLALAVSGAAIVCAWVDDRSGADDLWTRTSFDGGTTFGPEVALSPQPGAGNAGNGLDLAVDALGTVVALFEDAPVSTSTGELWSAVGTGFGSSWAPAVPVGQADPTQDDIDNPQIALLQPSTGTQVVAVWEDDRTGLDEVYVSVSGDLGLSWSPDELLSSAGGAVPRLSKDDPQRLAITWVGGGFPNQVRAAFTLDGGTSFQALATPLSDLTSDADEAEIALHPQTGNVVICWLTDAEGPNRARAGGFSLCGPATAQQRNAGSNPDVLRSGPSILGTTWTASIDMTVTGHALATVIGYVGSLNMTLPGGQVLLTNALDPGGELLGRAPQSGPLASFSLAIPNEPALCDTNVSVQGVLVGTVSPFALSNAVDLVVGAF